MLPSALRLLLGLALLLGASRASAQQAIAPEAQTRARMHFQQGKAAFELGNFQEALDQYKTAYRIAPLPGFLFNIAQCHRNLGDYKKAIFAFRLYLQKRPDARNRDAVLQLIDELQRKIDERAARDKRLSAYVPTSRPFTETPPPPPPPIYKRWWLWTLVGVAVTGAALGIYFGTRAREAQIPDSALGVWVVPAPR